MRRLKSPPAQKLEAPSFVAALSPLFSQKQRDGGLRLAAVEMKPIDWFFFFGLFLFFLLSPTDPDLGWHLRCGQEFWQQGSFCSQNQFSVLLPDYFWPHGRWLYQAIIFPLYQLAGLWGLTIFNALLMMLALVWLYLAMPNYRAEKMLGLGLVIFLGWGVFRFGLRNQLVGFFFFTLLLWLERQIKVKPKLMAAWPLIMLLWANLHGSFILGLILLGFFWLKAAVNRQEKIGLTTVWLLLAVAATLINPFGGQIYQEAWRHFGGVKLGQLIAEWVPPSRFRQGFVFLTTASLFLLLLTDRQFTNKLAAFFILPWAFLALRARRHLPFFFSLALIYFFSPLTIRKRLVSWQKKKKLRTNLAQLIATAFFFWAIFIRLPFTIKLNSSWENYCRRLGYPCQAIEFLRSQSAANIFNRYEWGGFLIWQLPDYKIFVDGRMPAWPTSAGWRSKSPYTIYLETLQNQPGWQKTLTDYQINWILISPGTFMDLKLKPQPEEFGYQEVYRDSIAVIYQKPSPLP